MVTESDPQVDVSWFLVRKGRYEGPRIDILLSRASAVHARFESVLVQLFLEPFCTLGFGPLGPRFLNVA